jgi:uncharacterized protein YbjT (DUF2867 family)
VLVVGSTGKTGYHIVKELLQKGYAVRVITRNKAKADQVFGSEIVNKLEVVECDLDKALKTLSSNEGTPSIL